MSSIELNGALDAAVALIDEAVASEFTVTVTKTDGRRHTGIPKLHPTDPDLYVIRSGRRGRPAIIHPDEIEELTFE